MAQSPSLEVSYLPVSDLVPYANNSKIHTDRQIEQIAASIERFGDCDPIGIWHDADGRPVIVEGHGRALALERLGISEAPVISLDHLSDEDRRAYSHVHNQTTLSSGLDEDILAVDLEELGDLYNWEALGFDIPEPVDDDGPGTRAEFGEPPLTVLNSRTGEWQERKRWWWDNGLASDEGRDGNLTSMKDSVEWGLRNLKGATNPKRGSMASGTSVFDPVLCELMVAWYSRPGDLVLDPFAGGATRGVVSTMMGRSYTGVDLSSGQIESDRRIAEKMGVEPMPDWRVGDSARIGDIAPGSYDMILTCPPYGPLERYGDGPGDLSMMGRDEFNSTLASIMAGAADMLRDDRFMVVVLGDYRETEGGQWGLISSFDEAMRRPREDGGAGLALVNHAILLNAVGTAAWRCRKSFLKSRVLTTVHQHILIYRKGDRKRAVERLGDPDFVTFEEEPEE